MPPSEAIMPPSEAIIGTAVQRVMPPYKAIMLLSKVIMPPSKAIMSLSEALSPVKGKVSVFFFTKKIYFIEAHAVKSVQTTF